MQTYAEDAFEGRDPIVLEDAQGRDVVIPLPQAPDLEIAEIKRDPHLNLREKRILTACLLLRDRYQYRLARLRARREGRLAAALSGNRERHDFWTGPGLVGTIMRYLNGPGWLVQQDFVLATANDVARTQIDQQLLPERNEAVGFACDKEELYRARLVGAGAQAKRVFNDIAISGRSLTRFAPEEVAAAQNLPHPLTRAKEKRLTFGNG